MIVLFLFRMFVLGAAADKVWGDEVSEFYCDSLEPGCQHACYNQKFPLSYVHYWVLQITFVSTPTLVYLGHAVHIIHKEKQLRDSQDVCRKTKYTDERGKVKIRGILFCTYMIQLITKIFLEVGLIVGQFYIFGFIFIPLYYHCEIKEPCASSQVPSVTFHVPTEKTIFIMFMLVVSGISVIQNIIEIICLLCNKSRAAKKRLLDHSSQPYASNPAWKGTSSPTESSCCHLRLGESAATVNAEPVQLFWKTDKKSIQIDDGNSKSFSFDRVFTAEETTNQLYQDIAKPLVVSTVEGYNGSRFKEGCNINRSLFTLGQVIEKVTDESLKGFTNYRDSKLTHILQNSLGGNAKTVVICTVTLDQTLSTLQWEIPDEPDEMEISQSAVTVRSFEDRLKDFVSPERMCELSGKISNLELQLEMESQQKEEAVAKAELLGGRVAELELQLQTEA
ncbi:hypothetical protein Q5P01_000652 [Channa striata]|uniref:Kinesin motor domain-containing protein n=1 Tax=Channa striata TaxID=64152 RepID=A0AA88II71_CHASR|nr:hypothetical protein Q5P01_000652 [Channa striata]